jgi:carbonic anhydrase
MLKHWRQAKRECYSNTEPTNIDYIIIIPNQGCGGCITAAEEFYKKQKMSKNMKFIFTNIISQKTLKRKIQVFSHNTFLDTSNIMLKSYPKNKSLYPCILKLKDGAIAGIVYQSPTENGFNNLIIK